MSCSTCNTNNCGCISKGLTTPNLCPNDTPVCPDPIPCDETTDANCVIYTGPPITGTTGTIIPTNTPISTSVQNIVNYINYNSITPTSVTFTSLTNLINTNSLTPGAKYLISNFQTIYDQPDYTGNLPVTPVELRDATPKTVVATKTGPIEPLIVTAATTNALLPEAVSTLHPKDQIKFDITFTNTEVMNAPAKGRIIERIDEWNNRTDYDHRHILFKRYKEDPITSRYNVFYDTGYASSEFLTFDLLNNNSTNNYIGNNTEFNLPFLLSNNVFDNDFSNLTKNNIIGNNCVNNSIAFFESFKNNNIKNNFIRNRITGDIIDNNNINFQFINNNIVSGSRFINNTINNYFVQNIITESDFESNIIDNSGYAEPYSFKDNNISYSLFYSNTIRGGFASNNINNSSQEFCFNVIETNFTNNTILNVPMAFNKISFNFINNTINAVLEHNTIGDNCGYNIFNGLFTNNTIGNYCGYNGGNTNYSNTFGNADSNTLGNYIWNNEIGDRFNNNVIGDYFGNTKQAPGSQSNIIGEDFQNNQIGNYFGSADPDLTQFGNTIGNNFRNNQIKDFFYANTIADGFGGNVIQNMSDCITYGLFTFNTLKYVEGSTFRNNFKYNKIDRIVGSKFGADCTNNIIIGEECSINIGFETLSNFSFNEFNTGYFAIDFINSASPVYGNTNCKFLTGSNGTIYMSYFDGTNVVYVAPY